MFLSSRRYFAGLILSLFFLVSAQSQTLYWVGGSGNFNDPNHWSLAPGGPVAGIVPGFQNEIVFDEYNGTPGWAVTVTGVVSVKSIRIETYKPVNFLAANSNARIKIKTSFKDLLDNTNFNSNVPLEFTGNLKSPGLIVTGKGQLNCDVFISAGEWEVYRLWVSGSKKLDISNSKMFFNIASVQAGTLNINNCPELKIHRSTFQAGASATFTNCSNYSAEVSYLNGKRLDENFKGFSKSFSSGKFGSGSVNSLCGTITAPILTRATCVPGCDGQITLTLPQFTCYPSPTPTAYVVVVSNICQTLSTLNQVGPGTYTFNNICNCNGPFSFFIYDHDGEAGQNLLEPQIDQGMLRFTINPTGGVTASNAQTISCYGACTGTQIANFPTIFPPVSLQIYFPQSSTPVSSVVTGATTFTGLCAGTLSIIPVDAGGCVLPPTATAYIRGFAQPSFSISANPVSRNVACYNECTGGYTITPSGGNTPNYTVLFSNGPSFTPTTGVAVNAGTLCAGVITATVLDSKNCPLTTTYNVLQPPSAMSVTSTFSPITCGGSCTGYADVLVTGSTGNFTYSWSANPATTYSNGTLCANTPTVPLHTVTVTETTFGCQLTRSFSITETPSLVIVGNATNVVCHNAATGAISATLSGGTPVYTVSWVQASTNSVIASGASGTLATITGLTADTYTLNLLDAAGCSTLQVFTLTQPATAISLSTLSIKHATCIGSPSGSVALTASGGNGAPFTYNWIGGSGSSTAAGLTPGNYTASVSDASNCPLTTPSNTISFTIDQPLPYNFQVSTTSLSCNNNSLGVISATPVGGIGPYNITLASSTGSTTVNNATVAVFNNLNGSNGANGVGNYTVIVTDIGAPGTCAQTSIVPLSQPASQISTTITLNDVKCNGASNGTVSAIAAGGSTPYATFSWTTPAGPASGQTLNNVIAGNYQLVVTDANGCTSAPTTSLLQEPTTLSLSATVGTVSCAPGQGNSSNGSITTTLSGGTTGTSTFTYNWNGPGVSGASTTSISNLPGAVAPNGYTLTYGDVIPGGCVVTTVITVAQPSAMVLSANTISTTCTNSCNGTAQIIVANGRPNYTYQFVGSSAATNTNGVFPNVCGPFSATVTDQNSCQHTITATVGSPSVISIAENTAAVTCSGAGNGGYTVTANGGVIAHSYTLSGPTPSVILSVTTAVFSNLQGGNYILSVVPNGTLATCPQTFAVIIPEPFPIVPNPSVVQAVSCFSACNGALTANPTGGTGSYQYTWTSIQNSVTGQSINSRCANVHTVLVSDQNNCTQTATINLTEPSQISISNTVVTNATCFQGTNGAISYSVSGGPPGGYSFLWTPGNYTTQNVTGVTAGIYQVVITSSVNSCTGTFTFNVGDGSPISLTAAPAPEKCVAACNGSVAISVTGGVLPLTYSVTGLPASSGNTFSLLCPAGYVARVTDALGCFTTTPFTIAPASPLSVAMSNTISSCAICSGRGTVTATGGLGPYTYTWAVNSTTLGVSTNTALGLCFGNYTVTARDANLCLATTTLEIPQTVIAVISNTQGSSCFGANNGGATVQIGGTGTPTYAVSWLGTTPLQTGITANNLNPAIVYTAQVTDSSPGTPCVGNATVQVTQPSSITILGDTVNVTCPGINDGAVTTTVSGGPSGGSTSYFWSPTGFTTPNILNVGFGLHTVTVSITNSLNTATCTAVRSFSVDSPDDLITGTFVATPPSNCINPNDGALCINNSGGAGANTYSYSWSPAVGGNTNCVSGLISQNYQVTVTSNGCSQTFMHFLVPPTTPTLLPVGSPITTIACNGLNTGRATFSLTSSALGFTWSPAATTSSNLTTTSGTLTVPTNTTSQVYTVTAMSTNSCLAAPVTVTITQPASITVNSTLTNVTCNNGTTGAMTLQTTGGTGSPSYNYTLSTGATASGSLVTFNNLSVPTGTSAVITVTVRDAASCVVIHSYTLTQPPAFTYTYTQRDVLCFGACNGSINIIPTNGTGGLTYTWAPVPSATFAGANTSSITNLCFGVYSVTVRDVNGCVAIGPPTISIIQPTAALAINTFSNNHNITCFGDCNGAASFTASGGTTPYTYSWSTNSSTAASAASLCLGQHIATAVDQNSCVSQHTFTIIGPTVAITSTVVPSDPKCPGAFNGAISTTVANTQGNVNYSWTPVGTGPNPTGLSAGGTGSLTYTMTLTDDSACVHVRTVTLIDPPAITTSVAITASPTCFGDCDGAATASFSNAVSGTTVTWLPMNTTSANIAGLCSNPFNGNPNIYTVTVVDGNGCRDTMSFALNNPTQLLVNSTVTPAQCGPNNGSITISGSGGTPGYTFNWLSPLSGGAAIQTSLAAGLYSVIITDANSCRDTVTIPVASINGPSASPLPTQTILCNGICSGSVGITNITPTTAILTWLTPNPSTITSNILTNLCAGTYTAELNDTVAKCKNYYSFSVGQPPALITTSTMTEPTCFGICDGSLSVNILGGTPTYSLLWNGPNNFTAAAVQNLTNLCGGVYSLTVTDQNNCVNTINYSLPVLNNIVIQQPVSVNNNICYGDCSGSATVNVVSTTNNVLTATLNWSNSQFGNVATGLCSGVYSVLVTDTRGCSNTFSVPITSPSSITLSSNVVQPNCNRCDGSAVVTASGGNGPAYTYSWTTGDNTSNVTDLCAGLYQVVVSDNLNCQQLHNVTINSSNGISGDTVIVQHEQCGLPCSGAATITAQGGASPITYNWLLPSVPGASTTASNLCPGQYFVQMRDANNCIRTTPFTINPSVTPTISAFVLPPDCGVTPPNGSIQVAVSGLTGLASYSWAPVTSSLQSVNNLGAGLYTVTVTDLTSGCSSSMAIPVSNSSGPEFTVNQRDINCAGQTGSVGVTLTSTSTVTYSWSTGATGSSVSNLPGGPLTVTITDANGCEATRSFTISSNPPFETAAITEGIRCVGNCDGMITVLPVGGTLPYSFTWSPAGATTLRADSLCPGNFTIVVADAKGCTDTSKVDLVAPIAVSRTVNTVNSSCSTVPDGSASIVASGGLAPYTYSWTGPNNFTSTADSINNILPGSYTVVAIDSLGCLSPVTTITVPPTVVLEANAGPDVLVCPLTDVVLTGSNSIGAISYTWIADPTTTVAAAVDHSVLAVETQTFYLVTLSPVAGCVDRDTVVVNLHPQPFLDPGVSSFTIPVRSNTVIGGNPTSLMGGPTHTWAPAEYLSNPMAQNPVTNNTINVTFTVSILYGDNCLVSDTVQVLIQPEVRITSGFSPNGDGKNDTWIIDYIEKFPNNSVEIYNRWGDQVFYSVGYFEPFDGNYKGQKLPVGTYYYVIKLNDESYPKPYTGPLTIFR